jgi:hypothetical protein
MTDQLNQTAILFHVKGTPRIQGKAISCFFSVLRQFKFVKPTCQPGGGKQALKNKIVLHVACCVNVKEQKKNYLFHLSTAEILNKEYRYKIIARIIENITRLLHSQHNM